MQHLIVHFYIFLRNFYIKADNATISGANVHASENLEVEVNKLKVESVQDSYYSKGSGFDVSLSAGVGMGKASGGSVSAGGSFSSHKEYTDNQWVAEQTTLTGGKSVNIKAKEEIEIKGAVIANAEMGYDEEGKIELGQDKGNLTLETKSIKYSDIKDKKESESSSISVGVSNVGIKTYTDNATGKETTANADAGNQHKYATGSTNFGMTAKGTKQEAIRRATIGRGKIIITGEEQELTGLNREIEDRQEEGKEVQTRGLDINTTIDNRVFSEGGMKSISDDFENMPGNVAKTLVGAVGNVASVLKTAYDVAFTKGIGIKDAVSEWKTNQTTFVNQNNMDRGTINNLSEGKSTKEISEATGGRDIVYNGGEDKETAGFRQEGNKDEEGNYMNAQTGVVTNTEEFIKTDSHENGTIKTCRRR